MGGLWDAGVKSFKALFYKSTATLHTAPVLCVDLEEICGQKIIALDMS